MDGNSRSRSLNFLARARPSILLRSSEKNTQNSFLFLSSRSVSCSCNSFLHKQRRRMCVWLSEFRFVRWNREEDSEILEILLISLAVCCCWIMELTSSASDAIWYKYSIVCRLENAASQRNRMSRVSLFHEFSVCVFVAPLDEHKTEILITSDLL